MPGPDHSLPLPLPRTAGRLVLRLGLALATFGWGISFAFTFAHWDTAVYHLHSMGARELSYQPMMDYWLRMASVVFGCIGVAAALACWKPESYRGLIHLLPWFHFFTGTVLLVAAIRNELTPRTHTTFVLDITFCFLTALLIQLPLWRAGRAQSKLDAGVPAE